MELGETDPRFLDLMEVRLDRGIIQPRFGSVIGNPPPQFHPLFKQRAKGGTVTVSLVSENSVVSFVLIFPNRNNLFISHATSNKNITGSKILTGA